MPTNEREMPNECRDAFETHTKTLHGYDENTLRRKPTGAYFCGFVNAGWIGWQAAWQNRSDLAPAAQGDVAEAAKRVAAFFDGENISERMREDLDLITAAKPHPAPETIETFKLPFEVKIGNNSFGKGVSFKTFLDAANKYYEYAVEGKTAPVAQSQEVLSDAPCKKCGYNGVGYYQPDTHPCAATQNQPAGCAEGDRAKAEIADKMFDMAFQGLMAIRDFSYEPEAKMAENTIKEIEEYEECALSILTTGAKK